MSDSFYRMLQDALLVAALIGGVAALAAGLRGASNRSQGLLSGALGLAAVCGLLAGGSCLVGWIGGGRPPFSDLRDALRWAAFGLMAFGFLLRKRPELQAAGLWTLLMGLFCGGWAYFRQGNLNAQPAELTNMLLAPHVALIAVGFTAFAAGAGLSLMILAIRTGDAGAGFRWSFIGLAVAAAACFAKGGGSFAALMKVESRTCWFGFVVSIMMAAASLIAAMDGGFRRRFAESMRAAAPDIGVAERALDGLHAAGFLALGLGVALGAIWADRVWGAFWEWGARQSSCAAALLLYGGLLLRRRSPAADLEKDARFAVWAFALLAAGFGAMQFLNAGRHDFAGF